MNIDCKSEKGNVESSLVMLPLISLFLIALQLVATLNFHNLDMTKVQQDADYLASDYVSSAYDELQNLETANSYDRLQLEKQHKSREIPQIYPGVNSLVSSKYLKSNGVSVVEYNRTCKRLFGIMLSIFC